MNATQEVEQVFQPHLKTVNDNNTQHEKGLFIFPQLLETQDVRM